MAVEAVLDRERTIPRQGMCRALLANPTIKHNGLLLLANLLAGLCGYLLHAVLGHFTGLAAYGTIASLLALLSVFLIPTQVIATVVARYGSTYITDGHPEKLNDLAHRLTKILLPLGAAVTVLFLGASEFISDFLHLNNIKDVSIIGLSFLVAFVAPINTGALQGLQRFSWSATLLVAPVLFRLVLGTLFVALGFGVAGAVAGIALSSILSYLVSIVPLRHLLRGPRSSCGSLGPVWAYSLTATAALTSTNLLYNLDTLLAKHLLSEQQASLYAGLATVGKIVLVAGNSVVMVMFPKFAVAYRRGEGVVRSVLVAICGVTMISAIIEIAFLLLPNRLPRILLGASFSPISAQLGWYGMAMLLFALAQVLIYYFLSIADRLFACVVLACCALQSSLFFSCHRSVGQLVQAVFMTKGILLAAMVVLFVVHLRRTRRQRVQHHV